jgi:hypothetical protein
VSISDLLTAILVFVTAIYSYLTFKMARATEASVQALRDQSEALLRPYVAVTSYVRPHTTVLYLKIENTGKSTALDLKLEMDRNFFQFGHGERAENNLRTKQAFAGPIQSLPPGGKLNFALAQGPVIFGPSADPNVVPQQFAITATYSFAGKRVTEQSNIDLRPYIGSEGERDPLVDELERLREAILKAS